MQWSFGEIASIIIFLIGVYGVIGRRNIMKTVVSIGIMDAAVILFFITSGSIGAARAPIGVAVDAAADPYPQAFMITAIVIGVGVTAVALTMFIHLYHRFGTTNWEKARRMREKE